MALLVAVAITGVVAGAALDQWMIVRGYTRPGRLFGIGWSWAGPMSLAVPYRAGTDRVSATMYEGTVVRLSIGLEDPDDLIRDLEAALEKLGPTTGA